MEYELYRNVKNKEDYFNSWKDESVNDLTESLKETIYQKYLMKCETFMRDNFTCQNSNCLFCHNKKFYEQLTVHHIKAQRNNGEDKARNAVTLCKPSHQHFEKAKGPISFSKNSTVAHHLRGHTFRLSKSSTVNWKKIKAETKRFRKSLGIRGIKLSNEEIIILLKWLKIISEE